MLRVQASGKTRPPSILTRVRRGAHVVINGKKTEMRDCMRVRLGLKHFITLALYGRHIAEFQRATRGAQIEKGADILRRIPSSLTYAFHDLNGIASSKRLGPPSKLSNIIYGIGNRRHAQVPRKPVKPSKETVANSRVVPTRGVVDKHPSSVANPNPMTDVLIDMLRKDGASEKVIQQFLNHERPRMYRFVGREELDSLLKGETVTSTRPCHNGVLTDITSNPDYGSILREGKYRITFKDREDFAPFSLDPGTSRVDIHALKNEEYYLKGGYSLDDVEKIEAFSGGSYTHVYPPKI